MAGEFLERRALLAGEGLTAQYFDNVDFTAAKLTRIDAAVNFDWGTSAPVGSVANTTYSVRWTGAVVPAFSELYTFIVTADDGVRLWIDDQLIVNNWVSQTAKAVSGQIALAAGQPVAVKLEYFQNTGPASVRLEWSSPSQTREVIPQSRLNATTTVDNRGTALQETWTNVPGGTIADLTGSAAFAGAPAYRQMITSLQSLQQDVGDANGARIRGFIVPTFTGPHTFYVAGNDACQLSLASDANPANAVRIAFTSAITAPYAWTASPTQASAPVTLVQGQRYYFEVLHKENGGYNHWAVGWTTPASATITVIGSDNIEPWGATTSLPATGILNGMSTGRDRILTSPEMLARAKALVAQGGAFKTWYDTIIARADLYLTDDLPPSSAPTAAAGGTQPILAGLEDNLTFLAGAYKLRTAVEGNETNSLKYFTKAKAVIQQVIQWSTWDTGSQFLGAAMVSQGISVCYDWMYTKFTGAERQQIADRLYTLAIKPCIDTVTARNYWTQWYGNWAFVCIGGVGTAALAIAPEYYKAEAETLLAKGWPVLQSSMRRFAGENGGWHEGPGYLGYGGLYLIRLMSALQTSVGTDYALSLERGFQQVPNFHLGISTTVTGNGNNGTYPYGNGDWSQNGDPWFYWLAQRFNRGDVAKVVQDRTGSTTTTPIVTNGATTNPTVFSFRTPWSLLWYDPRGDSSTGQVVSPGAAVARTDMGFYGDPSLLQWGTSGRPNYSEHVNVWRDSWTDTGAAVMFKGGYKGVDEHENLDGGSFLFDALGQRWATDLGRDSYSLPAVGGTNYGAYRKRAEGQNTLVINPTANDYLSSSDANERALNADQVYKDATGKLASAPVVKSLSSDLQSVGVVDLTNLYAKMRVSSVQRGFLFDRTDDSLLVQDEITAAAAPTLYWFMHVPVAYANRNAQIAISADGKTATITIGSNRLQCRILSGTGATFSLMEAKSLPSSPVVAGQTSNSGVTKLTITYTASTNERLAVWMVPLKSGQTAPTTTPAVTALAAWAPQANRQAWAGDVDRYAAVSAADGLAAAAAWSAQIASTTGKSVKSLDDMTGNRVVPVTLSLPLNPGEQVTWARLVAGIRTTAGSTSLDQLYLDSPTGQTYSSLGWGTIDTSATSRELTFSAAQLATLQDGTLNLAFSSNTAVDWVQLQYATVDATPPTVALTPSSPGSSTTPVGSVTVAFSEQVSGFDLADLALSRAGTPVSLAGASLTTTDNRTFVLGGLSGMTSTAGGYTLTLGAAGSGIVDTSGNAIAVGASVTWTYAPAITVPAGTTVVDSTVRSGGDRIVKRGAGTLVLTVAGTFTGGTVVEEGTVIVQHVDALAGGALDVRDGAAVTIDVAHGTVPLASLALAAAGRIDVGTGQISVTAGGFDEATIRSRLILGRNGGDWAGAAGIGSAAAAIGSARAVGYRVVNGALRLAWAAPGDVNLDGVVNFADATILNNGQAFGGGAVPGASWANGDFNYSGAVTMTDIIAMNNSALFGGGSYRSAPVTVAYAEPDRTSSGFTGTFTIRNLGGPAIDGWTLEFDLDAAITGIWNANVVSREGTRYTIVAAAWNSMIGQRLEVSFGFQADGPAGIPPRHRRFNGLIV